MKTFNEKITMNGKDVNLTIKEPGGFEYLDIVYGSYGTDGQKKMGKLVKGLAENCIIGPTTFIQDFGALEALKQAEVAQTLAEIFFRIFPDFLQSGGGKDTINKEESNENSDTD